MHLRSLNIFFRQDFLLIYWNMPFSAIPGVLASIFGLNVVILCRLDSRISIWDICLPSPPGRRQRQQPGVATRPPSPAQGDPIIRSVPLTLMSLHPKNMFETRVFNHSWGCYSFMGILRARSQGLCSSEPRGEAEDCKNIPEHRT